MICIMVSFFTIGCWGCDPGQRDQIKRLKSNSGNIIGMSKYNHSLLTLTINDKYKHDALNGLRLLLLYTLTTNIKGSHQTLFSF